MSFFTLHIIVFQEHLNKKITSELPLSLLVIEDEAFEGTAINNVVLPENGSTLIDDGVEKSYTEMEYDYAVKNGKPVLLFFCEDVDSLPSVATACFGTLDRRSWESRPPKMRI